MTVRTPVSIGAWMAIGIAASFIGIGLGVALWTQHAGSRKAEVAWSCQPGHILVREVEIDHVPACVPGQPAARVTAP